MDWCGLTLVIVDWMKEVHNYWTRVSRSARKSPYFTLISNNARLKSDVVLTL